jgi:4-hydroxybenzoate polyprenyltransferase
MSSPEDADISTTYCQLAWCAAIAQLLMGVFVAWLIGSYAFGVVVGGMGIIPLLSYQLRENRTSLEGTSSL